MTTPVGQAADQSQSFGERFLARAAELGPLCVGLDPHAHILERWGLSYDLAGLKQFTDTAVAAFRDTVAVVKPQVAFYEAFGAAGFEILQNAMAELRQAGVLVIADAKRGDIGSTMAGYANAWLRPGSPLEADALTVSPWLGVDSLTPVFELAAEYNKGAVVLAATSNPEAPSVQLSRTQAGATLAQAVCDRVAELNAGDKPGNVGVVVGATVDNPPVLDKVNGLILMPGVGAQGGTMADVRRICGEAVRFASPNVSRAVLNEGPGVADLQAAARRFAAELQV